MYKHMLKNYTIEHMLKNYTIQETTAAVSHSIYIRYWRGVGLGSRKEWGRSV